MKQMKQSKIEALTYNLICTVHYLFYFFFNNKITIVKINPAITYQFHIRYSKASKQFQSIQCQYFSIDASLSSFPNTMNSFQIFES